MSFMSLADKAAAQRAEMRKTVSKFRNQKALTRASLKEGRGAKGNMQLAGYEFPYMQNVPHGSTALNPIGGTTAFGPMVPQQLAKMFIGLTFAGFTVQFEHFHDYDARQGNAPFDKFAQRNQVLQTYLQERNWYAIGKGDGALAVITVGGGSGTITCAYDNTARGRSKGTVRLAVSPGTTAGRRVMYQSITPATGVVTATFYITSKASATTAVIVVTDGGTTVAGDIIVKEGHYNLVEYGLGYHNDDDAARVYQGISTATNSFARATAVDGASGPPTPTLVNTAKLHCKVAGNDGNAGNARIGRMTNGNYDSLSTFGYDLRLAKEDSMKTYGLPQHYEDGDTMWVIDEDFEDCEIHINDRNSLFYVRMHEIMEISKGDTQYLGSSGFGTTEFQQNWGEACNLAWDGRGDDAAEGVDGAPNTAVYIEGLEMPAITQVSRGQSLV